MPKLVQSGRDAAKGVALLTQIPNLRQRGLLRELGSKCCPSPARREPNAMFARPPALLAYAS